MIRYNNQDIVGCRRWNGTAWEDIKNVRKWNGTAWEDVELQEGVLYYAGMEIEQSRQVWYTTGDFRNDFGMGYLWTNEGLKLMDSMEMSELYVAMKYLPIHSYDYLNIEIEREFATSFMQARAKVVLKAEINSETYVEFAKESFVMNTLEIEHRLCVDLRMARENMIAMRLERLKAVFGVTHMVLPNFPSECSVIKKIWLSK